MHRQRSPRSTRALFDRSHHHLHHRLRPRRPLLHVSAAAASAATQPPTPSQSPALPRLHRRNLRLPGARRVHARPARVGGGCDDVHAASDGAVADQLPQGLLPGQEDPLAPGLALAVGVGRCALGRARAAGHEPVRMHIRSSGSRASLAASAPGLTHTHAHVRPDYHAREVASNPAEPQNMRHRPLFLSACGART